MDDKLRLLAEEQFGVVTYRQLREGGVSRSQIEWRVRRGVWRPVLRGVYAMSTGELAKETEWQAALLAAGPEAALSHGTAARSWGIDPGNWADDERVHVTKQVTGSARGHGRTDSIPPAQPLGLPDAAGRLVHPGVVVHRSRALRHTRVSGRLPLVDLPDTIVDLATATDSAREAYGSVIRLATRTTVAVDKLRRRIEQRPPRRYRRAIAAAAELVAEGVDSALEAEWVVRVELPHGLPRPERQAKVLVDGGVRYEDLLYEGPLGRLIVRLDGKRFHLATETRFRDRRRDNAAQLRGDHRLVYGWQDVTGDPAGVAAEVRAMLGRIGVTLLAA